MSKHKDEPLMQIPESKWNEEQKSKEAYIKKVKNLQETIVEKDGTIEELQKALAIAAKPIPASKISTNEKEELTQAREAYKSFNFIFNNGTIEIELVVDPMNKSVMATRQKMLR